MSFAHSLLSRAPWLLVAFPVALACSTTPSSGGDDAGTVAGSSGKGGVAGTATGGASASGGTGGSGALGGGSGTGTTGGTGAGGAGTGGTLGGAGTLGAGTGGSAGTNVGGSAGTSTGGSAGTSTSSGGTSQAGQGGSAGSGAAAGSATAGGGGSGGSAGSGTGTGFFSDDFEADTVGMQPAGWDNFIGYVKNGSNPSGTTLALVDDKHVHGGTKAVHFHGDSNPAQLAKALMSGTNKLYVRVWVYMTRQLGQTTDMSANHESLIVLRGKSGDASNEIRFGEIKGAVGVNEVPSDNIFPADDHWHVATGPVVPANTWSCLEVGFLADSSPNSLVSSLGGTTLLDVTDLTHHMSGTPGGWENNTEPADWLAQKFMGMPAEIVIGWQSFSNAENDVWMDDLVLGNAPIGGCN